MKRTGQADIRTGAKECAEQQSDSKQNPENG